MRMRTDLYVKQYVNGGKC